VISAFCSYKCCEQRLLVVVFAVMALFSGEACMAEKNIYRLPEPNLEAIHNRSCAAALGGARDYFS
jgi:hypothetical protein